MKTFMTSKDPSATCNDDADANILKCTCKSQYPDFEFTFKQDKNLEKKIFKWSKENYLVAIPDDPTYCEVLFRKATKFAGATSPLLPKLADATTTPASNYIIAGTSFLK